jgi:hypothetical protein
LRGRGPRGPGAEGAEGSGMPIGSSITLWGPPSLEPILGSGGILIRFGGTPEPPPNPEKVRGYPRTTPEPTCGN